VGGGCTEKGERRGKLRRLTSRTLLGCLEQSLILLRTNRWRLRVVEEEGNRGERGKRGSIRREK